MRLIATIAGNGKKTPSSGDGGLAIAAAMDPFRLALDRAGNVYITDSSNDLVRVLTPVVMKPATMSVLSGDGQSATVGTNLTSPLILKVSDSTGAGIPGVLVNFTVSPEGAATLSPSPALTLNRWHGKFDGHARQHAGSNHHYGGVLRAPQRHIFDHGDRIHRGGNFSGRDYQRGFEQPSRSTCCRRTLS